VDARSNKGKTALHYAAANGHSEVIKTLLEGGATVDVRDRDGHTPLMLAANYGCNSCVGFLVEYGGDPNAKTLCGNTALTYAETNNHPDTLELLKKMQRAKTAA
jgi:ankyrin repeat protein